jgi:Zn finger protein HypA/HybF involved in hydrogenase expression
MRELQTARALFEKTLRQAGAARLKRIHLAWGEIAELDQAAFRDQWREWSRGTPLERAQLQFRHIPAEAQCMACFKKYRPVHGRIHCPHCGSFGAKILSGEEIHVEHIETDEE